MKNKINIAIVGCVLAALALGCSGMMKGREAAEAGVEKFHAQYNAEQFSEIYSGASQKFKDVTTDAEITEMLQAVHSKLGTVTKSSQNSWNVNTTTDGTVVTLGYEVEFSKDAKGTEDFVFLVEDNKATLVRFNIKSPQLVTR